MKIHQFLGIRPVHADIGLEIELEGRNLPNAPPGWVAHADGSLRGEAVEFVFERPMPLEKVQALLDLLKRRCKEHGAKIADTGRAGIHVHVNCTELTIQQLINFLTLWFIFEEPLVKWCGKDREGNFFCLRASDAYETLNISIETAKYGNIEAMKRARNNDIRYSAVNLCAIPKFGSLEFRSMRSTLDVETITIWCEILLNLRDTAIHLSKASEAIVMFSALGTKEFIDKCLGKWGNRVFYKNIEKDLQKGVRLAQNLAYISIPKEQKENREIPPLRERVRQRRRIPPLEEEAPVILRVPNEQPAFINPIADHMIRPLLDLNRDAQAAEQEAIERWAQLHQNEDE